MNEIKGLELPLDCRATYYPDFMAPGEPDALFRLIRDDYDLSDGTIKMADGSEFALDIGAMMFVDRPLIAEFSEDIWGKIVEWPPLLKMLKDRIERVAQREFRVTATACQTKTVAVASARRGDGRSSLVSCLGVALSNQWRQVILIDSDFRHPSLHNHFHLDNSLGLSNLLSNPDLELADVVQSTNYPRLQVITSGTIPANPTNLIRCPRMSWVLERVKESAELVLIDTAPSLDTADGTLMASQVDAVLMAVNATQTRQDAMDATLANLRRANRNILGFIWNQKETGPFSQTSPSQRYFRTTPVDSPSGAPSGDAAPVQQADGLEKLEALTPSRYRAK